MIARLWEHQNDSISIVGMYQIERGLFEKLLLPCFTVGGIKHEPVLDDVIFRIFEKCSELELLYPFPDYMKKSIELWSIRHHEQWNRLYRALDEQYNPLWNKDGNIEETDTESRNAKDETTLSGEDKTTSERKNETTYGKTQEDLTSAYNTFEYSPKDKSVDSGKDSDESEDETKTEYGKKSTFEQTGTITHSVSKREYGNIGVTMTQELLKAEISIVNYNIIDIIAEDFKKEYCVEIY